MNRLFFIALFFIFSISAQADQKAKLKAAISQCNVYNQQAAEDCKSSRPKNGRDFLTPVTYSCKGKTITVQIFNNGKTDKYPANVACVKNTKSKGKTLKEMKTLRFVEINGKIITLSESLYKTKNGEKGYSNMAKQGRKLLVRDDTNKKIQKWSIDESKQLPIQTAEAARDLTFGQQNTAL